MSGTLFFLGVARRIGPVYGISGTTTIIVAPLTTIINQFKADAIRYGISCVNCTEVSSDLSAFESRYDPLEIDLYIRVV